MATRSRIAIKRDEKLVESVYCHWDGYLECVGNVLLENYSTVDKVEKLISMNDISSLEKTIESSIFYNRDRGENTKSQIHSKTKFPSTDQEYIYLFENGKWFYKESGGKWKTLKASK